MRMFDNCFKAIDKYIENLEIELNSIRFWNEEYLRQIKELKEENEDLKKMIGEQKNNVCKREHS